MKIQHTRGPRHWQIEFDEPSFHYWLSSRKRGATGWQIEGSYLNEEAAIEAVKNLKDSLPEHYDAGHYPAAFERQWWKNYTES